MDYEPEAAPMYLQSRRAVKEQKRYDPEIIFSRLRAAHGVESMKSRVLSQLCGLSERQIKRALETGELDPYQFDHACIHGLGLNPGFVVGFEEWAPEEAEWAPEIFDGTFTTEMVDRMVDVE